jgi:hypothetical protein
VIVAAPTAGSCGALPGAVLAAGQSMAASEDDLVRAMLAAGMIGVFIAAHATFAAEVGGCQAECGSGSGMAAAALVTLAGGDRADPLARYVVDDEFGDLAHKEEGWANRIMFWRRDDAATQTPTTLQTSEGAVSVDAASEYARLQALTGGRTGISIAPRRDTMFKLPGL